MKTALLILIISLTAVSINIKAKDTSNKKVIATQNAPKAVGPYSQAIQVGNTLYLAGQIAINPKTNKMNHGSIEEQTEQVLNNIKAVLNEAGFSLNDIVQSQVFLTNLDHYKRMNQVYARYFTKHPPARAAVEVSRLPLNAKIEIMVTAVK